MDDRSATKTCSSCGLAVSLTYYPIPKGLLSNFGLCSVDQESRYEVGEGRCSCGESVHNFIGPEPYGIYYVAGHFCGFMEGRSLPASDTSDRRPSGRSGGRRMLPVSSRARRSRPTFERGA